VGVADVAPMALADPVEDNSRNAGLNPRSGGGTLTSGPEAAFPTSLAQSKQFVRK
jgi:hypothetical protein